ncbi:MAG TPA: hypothetical protein VM053_01610 [Gemmatimonadaceae bacterium]|nr:hypothetical protein [Gemmatimonadaceae bacterium]
MVNTFCRLALCSAAAAASFGCTDVAEVAAPSISTPGVPTLPSVPGTVRASALPFVWSAGEGIREVPLPDAKFLVPGGKWEISAKAMAINNKGVIVGCYGWPSPDSRAFVWSAETGFLDIHPPGDGSTCATAVNDAGVVAGSANFWGRMGFVWNAAGSLQFLPLIFGETTVNGINEQGDVVGSAISGATPADQREYGFVWNAKSGGHILQSVNGAPLSRAFDINDQGDVVGFDSRRSTAGVTASAAVLWRPANAARLGLAAPTSNDCAWQPDNGIQGDCAAAAVAINNAGEIAGTIGGNAFRRMPDGALLTLHFPDGRLSTAVGINAGGDIAGTAMTRDLKTRSAFVWKRNGQVIELGALPGRNSSDATGMNDHGQVVGFSQ